MQCQYCKNAVKYFVAHTARPATISRLVMAARLAVPKT